MHTAMNMYSLCAHSLGLILGFLKCTCIIYICVITQSGVELLTLFLFSVASAPTNLVIEQEGLTSIRVSWRPPTPLGDTTGYRIYYNGFSSGSVDLSNGSTDNYLLTGLKNGETYTMSIVATSQHLPSQLMEEVVELGKCTTWCCNLVYTFMALLLFMMQ